MIAMPSFPQALVSGLDPVFVASPTIRCGTTLMQRLLCSAPNTLIFGETCAADLTLLLNMMVSRVLLYSANRSRLDARLTSFLAGEFDDWILDLMPALEPYLAALATAAHATTTACREYAQHLGRPVWGMKYPGWSAAEIAMLRHVMPRAKWIYLHRDLLACLRSAKGRDNVRDEQELIMFCQGWVANLTAVLSWPGSAEFLVLRYDDLLGAPDSTLDLIAAFTGAEGIQRSVLRQRINGPRDGALQVGDASGYTSPAELTDREVATARAIAGKVLERLYGAARS